MYDKNPNFPELNLICSKDELRPALLHVKIAKDVCVATNAHVIGVVPTSDVFDQDFIDGMPEGGFYLHAEDWKRLKGAQHISWKSPEVIKAVYRTNKRPLLIEIVLPEDIKYPNWQAVMPGEPTTGHQIDNFGINPKYLVDLCKAIGVEMPRLIFNGVLPFGPKGITVKDFNGKYAGYGLIMPLRDK